MLPVSTLLAVLVVAPAAELTLKPYDWPQFRGPNRTGFSTETGLLKKWPDAGPLKVWTVSGCGDGYSSVAVAGGYLFGAGKKENEEYVWARDEISGAEKWSTSFATTRRVSMGNGPRGTPTYANGKVYAVSVDGTLACLDAATGKLLWSKSYTKEFGGRIQTWGYSESVLVDDGKVIGTPGSASAAMVAFNAETGEVLWKTEVKNPGGSGGYASPVKAEVGGITMYLNWLGQTGGLVGVDAKTGKLLWQYTGMSLRTAIIPSPVVRGDLVFASAGYNVAGAALLKMIPGEGGSVTVKELKKHTPGELQNHHGGMVPVGDYLYLGSQHNSGFPACVEFATGEIKWAQKRGVLGGQGSAATAAADGMIYFRYQNGIVVLVEANPDEFKPVSAFTLPEMSGQPSWPHPAIANGRLLIRDQDKLHCFDIKAKK